MLGAGIPPVQPGEADAVAGIIAASVIVLLLGVAFWTWIVSAKGHGRVARPTGVTRLRPVAVR
jgi:hypothetical protein